MSILLAAVLLQTSPDLDGRVQKLIDQMGDDDIEIVDRAESELLEIGPPAIDLLREASRGGEGDLELRAGALIGRIIRNRKLRAVLGKAPQVTFRAKDRPVVEILEELSAQAGVTLEPEELPAGMTASLDVTDVSVWRAVDELCRSHGGLMFAIAPSRVIVAAAPYRELPRAFRNGFFFFVDSLTQSRTVRRGASRTSFSLQAALALRPGASPLSAAFLIEECEDNVGTSLVTPRAGILSTGRASAMREGEALLIPLHHYPPTPPDAKATSLRRFRGRVVLTFALEMKRVLSLDFPIERGREAKAGAVSVLINGVRPSEKELEFDLAVTTRWSLPEGRPVRNGYGGFPWRLALRNSEGHEQTGKTEQRGSSSSSGSTSGSVTHKVRVTFAHVAGLKPAVLDLIQPDDFEEVIIPFDFKGLPLR